MYLLVYFLSLAKYAHIGNSHKHTHGGVGILSQSMLSWHRGNCDISCITMSDMTRLSTLYMGPTLLKTDYYFAILYMSSILVYNHNLVTR